MERRENVEKRQKVEEIECRTERRERVDKMEGREGRGEVKWRREMVKER